MADTEEMTAYVAPGRAIAVGPAVESVGHGANERKRAIAQKYAYAGERVVLPKREALALIEEGFLVLTPSALQNLPRGVVQGPSFFNDGTAGPISTITRPG